jgi:phosphoadenosine phosphosulfate reductase
MHADLANLTDPAQIVEHAIRRFGSKITLSCSFGGAGGMVLLDLAHKVDSSIDVFVLDTDFLFDDTYQLIDRVEARYGIKVRRLKSTLTPLHQATIHGEALWTRQPDLCCDLRKVRPMHEGVKGFEAWMTAIRRDQSRTREAAQVIEWDESFGLWKVCPLVHWSEDRVMQYVKDHDLPLNPLLFEGYTSIGCTHCTRKPSGDDSRSGRWVGFAKTECGLHARPSSASSVRL